MSMTLSVIKITTKKAKKAIANDWFKSAATKMTQMISIYATLIKGRTITTIYKFIFNVPDLLGPFSRIHYDQKTKTHRYLCSAIRMDAYKHSCM